MIKKALSLIILTAIFLSCHNAPQKGNNSTMEFNLAEDVKAEFIRSWEGYKKYAWGHDVLLPISKSYKDWYEQSLHISPIDAYSTIKVLGLDKYASEIENYTLPIKDKNFQEHTLTLPGFQWVKIMKICGLSPNFF